jgi:coenzyme F420-reducing hydrogenase gamma subunit
LQCFKKVDDSYMCSGCGFPMCNEDCANGPLHHDECNFFRVRTERIEKRAREMRELDR